MGIFGKPKVQNEPYAVDEMSFYDEEGLNIGYDNIPTMKQKNVKMEKQGQTIKHLLSVVPLCP